MYITTSEIQFQIPSKKFKSVVKLRRSAPLEVHDQYVDEFLFTGLVMNKFG